MASEIKGTPMLLKVDLQCPRCYKKIKKLLCRYHEIRDQVFQEKQNTVAITVFCCTPERIRRKLISRGGKSIKSIEIVQPPPQDKKPKSEPEKPKPQPAAADPKKPPSGKPKPAPEAAPKPESTKKPDAKPKEKQGPPPARSANPPEPAPKPKEDKAREDVAPGGPVNPGPMGFSMAAVAPAAPGYPMGYYRPPGYCYYEGFQEMAPPPQPPLPMYYGGGGAAWQCGCGGQCGKCRCNYFSEENPSACSVM